VLQGGDLHYRVPPGLAWSDMVRVDCPSRHPHDTQCVCSGSSGAMTHYGVGEGGWRLDGQREGEHGRHPWTTTHLPNTVESTSL
jgi:hypothetical protein